MSAYRAVVFDLLSALLDSWTLWARVVGDEDRGARWRRRFLELTYATGAYRPYEEIVLASARESGVEERAGEEVLARWDEMEPWPEAPAVLGDLAADHRLAVVTNCSEELARRATALLGVPVDVLVSAEAAGFYKPRPEPYRRALAELGVAPGEALYVAGSAGDVPGAGSVGLPVVWHNRARLPAAGGEPLAVIDTLEPLPGFVRGRS